MNSADLYNATDYENGIITYYRTKTKERRLDGAKMQVIVHEMFLLLIEKYRDKTENEFLIFINTMRTKKL